MKERQEELIMDLALNKISVDNFIKEFDFENLNAHDYVIKKLRDAYYKQDSDSIEYMLLIYFSLDFVEFNSSDLDLLGNILTESWHIQHENIALIMQEAKNPDSTPYLLKAMHLNLDYLKYNDGESLIRKCAFALGDIDTTESWAELEKLKESKNELIKKSALEQLNRK